MVSTRSVLGMCDVILLDCHLATEFYVDICCFIETFV